MSFVRAAFRFIIGVIFGAGSALALTPAIAAFFPPEGTGSGSSASLLAIILGGGLLAAFAPTIRRAFGRGFLALGVCLLALPLSAFWLWGSVASDVVSASGPDGQAMAALGAGLAGAAVTGMATFVGLILGSIMLVTGLVLSLGGRREVIVVGASPHERTTNPQRTHPPHLETPSSAPSERLTATRF